MPDPTTLSLIISVLSIAISAASVTLTIRGRHRTQLPAGCPHIWAPWEPCDVLPSAPGRPIKPGQIRECLSCGISEAREVIAKR